MPSTSAKCSCAAAISPAPRPPWEKRAGASRDSAQMQLAYGVAAYGQRRFARGHRRRSCASPRIDASVQQPYVFLARILGQAGDRLPQVVAAFAAWENAEPANYLAVCLHAKALSAASGDAAEIEAKLRRSIQLNDDYWESHFELGVLLGKNRDWNNRRPSCPAASR